MKKTLINLLLTICAVLISGCSGDHQDFAHRQNDEAHTAWIAIESCNSGLKILPFCRNNTSQDVVLRYDLKAEKTGAAGTAQTSQAGSVHIAGWQKECLSRLSLSVSASDQYQIELKVYKDKKLVAEDFVSYPKEL